MWSCLKRKTQCASGVGKSLAMKRRCILESEEQRVLRKDQDRVHKVSMRTSESREQTLHRQEQDRVHKVSMRASESCDKTLRR